MRTPRPTDWGIGMTVCIATMCERGKKIVAVSDHMLSMGSFTADGLALKDDVLHPNWFAMWAHDVSYVPALLECVEKQLDRNEEYEWMAVSVAFQNAYAAVLRSEINSSILTRYKYDLDSFYKRGKNELTTSAFNNIHQQIRAFTLDADFLVYGFDERGDGHIFTFKDGITKSCDKAGMWAIGSGDYGALSTLFFSAKQYHFNQNRDLPTALYATLAAKYMAESAESVGEKTFVVVNKFNHLSGYMDTNFILEYRKRWFKEYAPKWPTNEIMAIGQHYKPGEKRQRPYDKQKPETPKL